VFALEEDVMLEVPPNFQTKTIEVGPWSFNVRPCHPEWGKQDTTKRKIKINVR
jgi:hypothetical protein